MTLPAYQQPAQAPAQQFAPVDPGKTLGIVGLVLAIVFGLPGLVVGIVARKKSKEAGFSNGMATAAIWVGAITLALSLLMIPIMLSALNSI